MKTLIRRPVDKDGVGESQNLKLTHIQNSRKVIIDSKRGSTDFHDEYFFGYTDTHPEHSESKKRSANLRDL